MMDEVKNLVEKITNLKIKEDTAFTRKEFVEGLRTNKFKKITFLTGAGMSVAAGIPDFRSPGTGIYSRLAEYNLPYPEAIFDINFFKK